jgi:hypothetical protein
LRVAAGRGEVPRVPGEPVPDDAAGLRAANAHFDETGFGVAGRLAWVHSASSGKYVLVTVHEKRGKGGMDAAGVLPAFGGIACHDAWARVGKPVHLLQCPAAQFGSVGHCRPLAAATRSAQSGIASVTGTVVAVPARTAASSS